MYAVISPSAFPKISKIMGELSGFTFYITTYGVSYALSRGIDIDSILDRGIKVRAFSHNFRPIEGLDMPESEAILVARELNSVLVTSDENVKKAAEKEGVKVLMI
ncbi:PIN domain-containing protein [Acidianus sp. RZ1]|uniref:PIN domain-containing protein n=1 Tax=Acidianus sp. RZ1 TaxID=1540082 RepID=UPI001492C73D|nr:PIN domain-containing protein [Acidianus sp. RZ1]NON63096.1 hypothetical protein [Acidianus sp. RZ1]